MNVIFFGFKGCGKTTLGQAVAKDLGRPFLDTDTLFDGSSALYKTIGENAFRILEANAIQSLSISHSIISVGGGAMMNPINVHALSKLGTLIYLKVDPAILKERNCKKPLPAILDPLHPEASFDALYATRSAAYEAIPSLHFDLSGKERDAAIQELCTIILGGLDGS